MGRAARVFLVGAAAGLVFGAGTVARAQSSQQAKKARQEQAEKARSSSAYAQPEVAFTFDDLPAHGPLPPGMARPAVVASILATLKREQMPPVYGFVNGFRMVQFPYQIEILKAWHDAGEPLGSHTWSHPELDKLTAAAYEQNIARNEAVLKQVDPDGDWHWFRYPYLEEGDTLAKRDAVRGYLRAHGYRIADVSINFQDYMWDDAYGRCSRKQDHAAEIKFLHDSYLEAADHYITAYRGLSQTLFGRDIAYVLLLHVGSFDAKMLPELIALYRSRGFLFVTLPEAESDPAYAIDPHLGMPGGGVFLDMIAATHHVAPVPDIALFDKVQAMCQ